MPFWFMGNFPFLQNPSVAFPENYTLIEVVGTMCKQIQELTERVTTLENEKNSESGGN